jgi:hypothetical protein
MHIVIELYSSITFSHILEKIDAIFISFTLLIKSMSKKSEQGESEEMEGLSLSVAALIGKAMNDTNVLDAITGAKESKGQLRKAAREKACIELSDCDLEVLLKIRYDNRTILDLIEAAKKCLKQNEPGEPPKWCC